MKSELSNQEAGFSLIELLIVVFIIAILSAFILMGFRSRSGESKKTAEIIDKSLKEREAAARRLNQANSQGLTDRTPIEIDFADLSTTAPLRTDGADANNDGVDDNSGEPLTNYDPDSRVWRYEYEGRPINLPSGWTLVESNDALGLPTIPNSKLTTKIEFDEDGRPASLPVVAASTPPRDEAPFWALYFKDNQSPNIAVALAVHGSGLTEIWTYDFNNQIWTGNGGRR